MCWEKYLSTSKSIFNKNKTQYSQWGKKRYLQQKKIVFHWGILIERQFKHTLPATEKGFLEGRSVPQEERRVEKMVNVSQSAQATITNNHSMGGLNSKPLFLSSGGWEVWDQGHQIWCLVRVCFLVYRSLSSHRYPQMTEGVEKGNKPCVSLLKRGTNSIIPIPL